MNNLKYINLQTAFNILKSGGSIENGTVVVAECGAIECVQKWDRVAMIEAEAGSSDWNRSWGDGVYCYELLIARDGVQTIVDGNGNECGYRVVGTNRGVNLNAA